MVAPPKPGERPQFKYPAEGIPELVDYQGQKKSDRSGDRCWHRADCLGRFDGWDK